jgi:hypothetical protein
MANRCWILNFMNGLKVWIKMNFCLKWSLHKSEVYLLAQQIEYKSFLDSLHVRLALALHMAYFNSSKSLGLCETKFTPGCLRNSIRYSLYFLLCLCCALFSCLFIRSIHIACDFHVEQEQLDQKNASRRFISGTINSAINFSDFVLGSRSLLFECNKGPDMQVHDTKDGRLKFEISADFASFIGIFNLNVRLQWVIPKVSVVS